uniref:Zinc finger protein RFP-like n=1 Tax=Calidris pygmaea TaxID=425635 RepID=A0A8C3KIZ1_9CHAR
MEMPLEILRDEACCSICLEIFQDPVSISCGHSFCRLCITRTWEGLTTNFSCPQCRKTVSRKRLRPNRELANVIEAAKSLNLQPVREVEGGENLCEEHQEPLKLFCQDDKRLICVVCDRSKVHRDHFVVPMDEATQEYKVNGFMGVLRYKGPETKKEKRGEVNHLETVMGQEIVTTYRKLHEFLEKQESSLLAQLEQLDTEIRKAHEEILQRLLEETTSLGTLIGEMERTYQQPDWQLLKVRAQRKSPLPPRSAAMSLTLSPPPAPMTLDPQTANPRLYLSEDCKLVRWERREQELPSNPRRFNVFECVLGSRGFKSGFHHWDVEVHREGVWAIGVAKASVPRDRWLRSRGPPNSEGWGTGQQWGPMGPKPTLVVGWELGGKGGEPGTLSVRGVEWGWEGTDHSLDVGRVGGDWKLGEWGDTGELGEALCPLWPQGGRGGWNWGTIPPRSLPLPRLVLD